ncbi:translation protein SH3-like domain-containing protein [Gongronella butleri]|nr:translation protein SH3-like domain-containing protein [Gongronella butleri]
MHRIKAKGISSRMISREQWVAPKDRIQQWHILTGDKVGIIAGKDKGTIGEIKSVNRATNTVIVEGKKLAKKHVPMQPAAPEGIMRKELPIHVSNVMLLHPDTQMPIRIDRRRVEQVLDDGRVVNRWTRFVKNSDVEIPKPVRKYNDKGGEELFTTSPEDVAKVTYEASAEPPVPADLIKELRNPYKHRKSIL